MIDPFNVTDGYGAFPSGDAYSVYPAKDGPIPALRLFVFYDALQDRMLFKALADKIGSDAAKQLILDEANGVLTFSEYPTDESFVTRLHDKVLDILG